MLSNRVICPAMLRRLRICQVVKLCVISGVFLSTFAVFRFQYEIEEKWRWLQHSMALFSFSHKVIILNSSTTLQHPMALPYPYPYKFIINQPKKCHQRKPFLVLLVIVESHDVVSRNTIRETWGDENNYKEVDVVRLFLLGQSPALTRTIQRPLEEESTIYGDIIQQDFLDAYRNLTLKTLMGMEWVVKFCPNASYVMKVDSDVFLNVDYLIHKLLHPELPIRQNFLTGYLVSDTGPVRDRYDKWFVPEELYPGNTYPPYPSGPGYVFSADVAKKVYDVAQEIAVITVEDAFIGMCLYKINISPTKSTKGVFQGDLMYYDPYKFCNVVMVHHYEKDNLRKVWMDFWAKKTLLC